MAFMYTTTIGMYELIRARALIIYELISIVLPILPHLPAISMLYSSLSTFDLFKHMEFIVSPLVP